MPPGGERHRIVLFVPNPHNHKMTDDELAEGGFMIGVFSASQGGAGPLMQAFAVGCANAGECIARVKEHSGVLPDARYKVGKALGASECKAMGLRPGQVLQYV
jgi:hypothetical protein